MTSSPLIAARLSPLSLLLLALGEGNDPALFWRGTPLEAEIGAAFAAAPALARGTKVAKISAPAAHLLADELLDAMNAMDGRKPDRFRKADYRALNRDWGRLLDSLHSL